MANLDKITIINGDFEKENFGISDEEYSNLTKKYQQLFTVELM